MSTNNALVTRPTPAEISSALAPFLGRRLQKLRRLHDKNTGIIDLWLAFRERTDAPGFLHITATPIQILPGFVSGGGPTTPALRVEVADSLPENPGEFWYPFSPPSANIEATLHDWALTEVWISAVICNADAPGGYRLQDVCGGLALHFSNTSGPNFYGSLLGMTYEHHDLDAPHTVFCDESLPPLVGSCPWRRVSYLKESTRLDDTNICHFSPHDFGTPALAGCTAHLTDTLTEFSRWFEREPRIGWLMPASTRRWLEHHRRHLEKVTNIFFYADLILQRSTDCGEDLKQDMAALGLGTLFGDAWAERDSGSSEDRLPLPKPAMLADIRHHFAPVREAYRQWFQQFRQACTAEQRRLVRWTYEPLPEWVLTLDAALTHGSLRFETLLEISGARLLRDDFRAPWVACEDSAWFVQQGGLSRSRPQDVLIEGDEEHTESLRITWWPMLQRRDQVIVLRAPRETLIAWWQAQNLSDQVSEFETLLAWQQSRPPVAEQWPNLSDILAQQAQPPRFDVADETLPPYTVDDIRAIYFQRMQGRLLADWPAVYASQPDVVWAFHSKQRFVPLLLGRDTHPLASWSNQCAPPERVVFPATWPATWVGRGTFYLMWCHGHWREERAEGLDFRQYNWLLPVMRQMPVTEGDNIVLHWRWGLIDIEGHFVLPCQYPAMSFPQLRGVGKPIQAELLPPIERREPWCWIWVGEDEYADRCRDNERHPAVGDIVEAWSGAHPLPAGLKARRLDGHFALVSKADADSNNAPLGLFNLATGHCGPIRWRYIDTFYLSIYHTGPAQCFETGLWTYVDENGEPLLPADFARADRIDSGLATVQLGLPQAEAQELTLTLPDGTQQGPVGVFGPQGIDSLGQWFLAPQWREVLGEYDGKRPAIPPVFSFCTRAILPLFGRDSRWQDMVRFTGRSTLRHMSKAS